MFKNLELLNGLASLDQCLVQFQNIHVSDDLHVIFTQYGLLQWTVYHADKFNSGEQYCRSPEPLVSSPDPKGHVSFCHDEASVVIRSPSLTFRILIFYEMTGPIWTKLGRNGLWVVPFQNCVRRPRLPTKMATRAKNRKFGNKIIKNLL